MSELIGSKTPIERPAMELIQTTLFTDFLGTPVYFSSSFAFQSALGNHRLLASHWGGPLQDIGVYCINAVRHVFESEHIKDLSG